VEVKLNTVQVVTANDDFASLEDATLTYYAYRFSLSVSKTETKNSYATKLLVRAYTENPKNAVPLTVFKQDQPTLNILNQNAKQLINNIQKRSFSITNAIITTRNNVLAQQEYDLNGLIKKFNSGIGYSVVTDDPKTAVKNKVYDAVNTLDQKPLNEDRSIAQLSKELLNDFKTDPADSIKRIYSAKTAYETNNGLAFFSGQNRADKIEDMIAASLLTTNNPDLTEATRLQAYSISERDVITIQPEQLFPAEAIGTSNFYLMFSIYDTKNNLVQEFVKFVAHKTNVSRFQRTVIPPDFSMTKLSDGKLTVSVKQNDPYGTGVRIYKSTYNPSAKVESVTQNIIGSFDLPPGESRIFNIQNNDVGLLLFRALSYNANSDVSSEFTSQVVEVQASEVTTRANVFVSLHPEYNRQGLNLIVSDIPDDIAFVELYKTNLTSDPYTETLITTFYVGGQGSNSTYAYFDSNLDQTKAYRYRCMLVDIKGQRYESSGMVELVYRPQTQDYAVASYTAPSITPVQTPGSSIQYYDVAFDVSYAITNKLEDNVKQFLINQGLIEYFGGDIKRERLKDLLVTKVELRDLQTNDKFLMGYIDNTYLQSTTKFGLLNRSSQYLYELTTYVRNPATLLQAIELTGSSTARTNSKLAPPSYTYNPFNLNNPYGLQTGTNPQKSGSEFVLQYGLDQLEFGDITGIDYINVDLKPPTPSINNLRASVFNSKAIDLTWSINGDQTQISHFIIRRQNVSTGKLDLIGKAHGINTQNNYLFTDMIRYTDTGVFKYIITMQYFNLNLSPDYDSNEVVI
jgi:hypothetical protein